MSWFSKPFARSLEPQGNNSDGDEEDDHAHGQGVKEDLSQLTQTFKRQLWGVASFLAPAPQAKDNAEIDDEDHHDGPQSKAPIEPRHDDHLSGTEFSEELVDVDFDAFLEETLEDKPAEASKGEIQIPEHGSLPQSSPPNVEQGLTGISRDLSELKGSVATGFTKILKAVRKEIEHEEPSKSYIDSTSEDEDDDNAGKSTKFNGAKKSQSLNMYLKPLIDNVLHSGKGKDLEKRENASSDDGDGEGDETDVVNNNNNVRPSNLQETFIHGLRGISEFASSLISVSMNSDDEIVAFEKGRSLQVVGLTEEVLAFARNISMHPETWLDFPLVPDDEIDDFEMSAAQKKHTHALEVACPGISALKMELCPDCMSENHFWKIYFILLHSRLSEMDASLLSTPKIMQARAHLSQKLEDDKEHEAFMGKVPSSSKSHRIVSLQSAVTGRNRVENLTGRPQTSGSLLDFAEEVQNKDVLANTVKLATSSFKGAETDAERWLNEEPLAQVFYAAPGVRDEDDVSFSDLEEDDVQTTKDLGRSNSTQSLDWVQLNKTSSVENFDGLKLQQGSILGGGTGRQFPPQASTSQVSKNQGQSESKSESSDWSTVGEDDAASSDSLPS